MLTGRGKPKKAYTEKTRYLCHFVSLGNVLELTACVVGAEGEKGEEASL
jgi:hypothetical protein